ncbi:MAG: helix-turn-helix domain-containing protein [Segniliparus sp.]|uniref:helix-turn-helix domain-containing protein n=1 Tax=Segniliparus sp. TaxID=2804064 RepID=UPI003F408554
MAMLLREALGASLRQLRLGQRRTLREVSNAASMSLGYLSEIERGQKEASSELLAAICGALAVPIPEVLRHAGDMMRPLAADSVGSGPAIKMVIPAPGKASLAVA